jgi:hypothetical protein
MLDRLVLATPHILQLTEQLVGTATSGLAHGAEQGGAAVASSLVTQAGTTAAEVMVTRGGKTTGEAVAAAGRQGGQVLSRGLAVVYILALAGREIYRGFCKAAQEQKQVEAALREVEGKAKLAAVSARQEFLGRVNHFVAAELAPVSRALREEIRALSQQDSNAEKGIVLASELRERLEAAILDLNVRTKG